jgi:hypothetical protein
MADFDAPILTITGLAEITLPTQTIRLCDGAFVYWGANKFESSDPDFGSIESVDSIEERVGDEAPGGRLTFLPVSTAAAATLSQPTFQGSPMKFWLARVNETTGLLDGTPELVFDGELDTTTLRVGRSTRALDMEFISVAERLFNVNEGNVLSPRFHKSVWAGELGLDNAHGVGTTVAWGVEGPPRGVTVVGSGGGFSGDGGALDNRNVRLV